MYLQLFLYYQSADRIRVRILTDRQTNNDMEVLRTIQLMAAAGSTDGTTKMEGKRWQNS